MRINCPTCEIEFEISGKQVGQKALCPDCETRFIIPTDPNGEFEVLSVGKPVEAEKEEPKEEPKEESKEDGEIEDSLDGDDSGRNALGLMLIGLAVGLVLGFLIGWLVWSSPDKGAAQSPDARRGEDSNPFLRDDSN